MMYWRIAKGILCVSICAVFGIVEAATPPDSLFLTVDQLFERGIENSLQLKADRLQSAMIGERVKTASSMKLPDVQIGLKGGVIGQPVVYQHGLSGATYPDTPDWSQNYAIDFTQPLYEGGQIRYAVKKAKLEQQAMSLQTNVHRSDLKLNLLEQYMELFSLYKQYEVLLRNIEESELRLHDIRRMKREGLITNNDVLRSEMQLTHDRLSLTEAGNNIRLVSQRLDILLGIQEDCLLKPDTALLSVPVMLGEYEGYVSEACRNAPSVVWLRKQTELARNEIKGIRAASLPKLSLYASNTLARPISRTMTDLYNNNWNIGVSLSYPLSSLYKNNHKRKESQLAVHARLNEEELQLQQIRMEVKTAYLRHQEAVEEVEALRLSVRQAEENYRIMQNRYLNQLAILTDLLDANTVRLNAELQLVHARTRVVYTYYQLQKVCGRL